MKTCKSCKQSKEYTEFYKKAAAADGYQYNCKECQRTRQRIGEGANRMTRKQKKKVYMAAIIRMRQQGLTSAFTTDQMLARVGEM